MNSNIQLAAFNWLQEQSTINGDVFTRTILEKGFEFHGHQISLLGPKGIWKPKVMTFPISITTISNGSYQDVLAKDGFLKYKYRGTDPYHSDNVGLRELMNKQTPLIYFHSIVKGKYIAAWPCFIQHDNMQNLTFTVSLDTYERLEMSSEKAEEPGESYGRRSYITSTIQTRLHQHSFRERVIRAYRGQCALCRLRHENLLDAAHIIPDKEEKGEPIVNNGLSLCKIHHAAFDKNIIGISPDYIISVRQDILEEIDGPMLKYGIQELNKSKLIKPRRKTEWPDRNRLAIRYNKFLKTA